MKIGIITALLCILYLISAVYCNAGTDQSIKDNSTPIEGTLPDGGNVSVFDGSRTKTVNLPPGKFKVQHSVTEGLYGVVFITKDGFVPETLIFKSGKATLEPDVISMRKLNDVKKGVITGVVYKQVRGGKLRRHNGIGRFFKDERITLSGLAGTYTVVSDDKGVFMMELPPGEYDIIFSGKKTGRAVIAPGGTVIKNILKGMVLVD
jgi:hypothetical protein